MPNER